MTKRPGIIKFSLKIKSTVRIIGILPEFLA